MSDEKLAAPGGFFETRGVREVAEYFRDAIIWEPETNRAVHFLAVEVWPKEMELLPGEKRNGGKGYGEMERMPLGGIYTHKIHSAFQSLINCSDTPGGQPGACVRPTRAEYGMFDPEVGSFEFASEFAEPDGSREYKGREGTIAAFFGLEVEGRGVREGRRARLVQSDNDPRVFILVRGEEVNMALIAEQSDPNWEALFYGQGGEGNSK